MSETTIAPCHICGERPRVIGDARGMLGDNAWRVTCHPSTAIYPTRAEAVAAWNDDARARALLRACNTLEAAIKARFSDETSGSVLLDDRFISGGLAWGEVQYGPLADALIALAGGGEQCSALSTCC